MSAYEAFCGVIGPWSDDEDPRVEVDVEESRLSVLTSSAESQLGAVGDDAAEVGRTRSHDAKATLGVEAGSRPPKRRASIAGAEGEKGILRVLHAEEERTRGRMVREEAEPEREGRSWRRYRSTTTGRALGEPEGMIWMSGMGISCAGADLPLLGWVLCLNDASEARATVVAMMASRSIRCRAMVGSK